MGQSAGNAPLAERAVWLSRPAERAGDWQAALEACDWNIREVSRRLAVGRATVYRKIEKYELDRDGRLGDDEDVTP